jgi:two-component system, LuxR family, response regulator FixJ
LIFAFSIGADIVKPLVYVVDDDDALRDALGWLLRNCGFDVASFGSGSEFLQKASPQDAHCAILDIQIGAENGLDVLARLRARSDLPVFILTGKPSAEVAAEAQRLSAAAVFEKPVHPDRLIAAIQAARGA